MHVVISSQLPVSEIGRRWSYIAQRDTLVSIGYNTNKHSMSCTAVQCDPLALLLMLSMSRASAVVGPSRSMAVT